MYSDEYFAHVCNHDPYARHTNEFKTVSSLDVVTQMQYVDARTYLTDDILVKVDKASMFNSLETRAPLLDQYLVAYVSSLPASLRMRDGTLKYLLKKAAADLLPPEILSRGKQGFAIPIKHWFRDDLASYAHEVLGSPRAQQRCIFNPRFVHNLLKEHARTKLVNHSGAIWALLCLELWFQVYMDSPTLHIEGSPQVQTISSR